MIRGLTMDELDLVAAAGSECCYCPPPPQHGGPQGNNGFGNGGYDGVPGNSNKEDYNR
jgi:hypothetical protein